jgi:N-acetylneuraminic acid mutarotase
MAKNLVNLAILWILLQVLVKVNCQMNPFKPTVYSKHTATLIDNKLYILGGVYLVGLKEKSIGKEFFCLDVSVPFNTQELLWQDLTSVNMLPPHNYATSAIGGANNDTLFLYGGYRDSQIIMESVYTFNSRSNSWNIPKITGASTIKKYSITGIMGPNNKLYLFSGDTYYGYVNDMLILNTINLNWEKGSSINAPTPRIQYGATLLPNNKIIYIGQ